MLSLTNPFRDPVFGDLENLFFDSIIDEEAGFGKSGQQMTSQGGQMVNPKHMGRMHHMMQRMASMNRFPAIHVKKTEDEYKICAELPGVEKSDLKVELCSETQGVKTLCISGERRFDDMTSEEEDEDENQRGKGQRSPKEQGQQSQQGQQGQQSQRSPKDQGQQGQRGSEQGQQRGSTSEQGQRGSQQTGSMMGMEEKGMKGKQSGMKGRERTGMKGQERSGKREMEFKFCRSITLPYDVDEKSIKAKYENGLLKVCMSRSKGSNSNVQQINLE